jgi:predicted MFS family arabinose efflux permease
MITSTGITPLRIDRLFLLMASVFTVSMGYGVVLPVLPFWLDRLAGSVPGLSVSWHTGMLTAVYMLTLFAFAPLWGSASDRVGRRPVILFGLGGLAAALVLFGLTRNLGLGYLVMALGGVFASAVLPATLAYVADTSTREWRARRFAWMSAASLLGFLAGPAMAGWLSGVAMAMPSGSMARAGAIWLPFVLTAAIGAAVGLASYFLLPEPVAPPSYSHDNVSLRQRDGTLKWLFLLSLLVMFGLGSFEVGITLLGQRSLGLDPASIGIMFMECSLVMLAVQALFFSSLGARFGRAAIAPAFLAMAAGLGLLPGTTGFGVLLLWVGLVAAGSGILLPLLSYRVSLHAGTSQGAALGRQTAAASLGQATGSAAAGLLFGIRSEAPFWLTAGLLVAGAAIALGVGTPARSAQ